MRIQHNIASMNSYRNFSANNSSLSKNLEKLSSGYKINRAGDDAAGLAISEKMRAQITGIEGATKNSKDGISLIQTAEGALTEVHSMLNRMTTLAEQSANGTYDNEVDRNQLQKEVESLKSEIDRIADSTNYNGIKLLDGSLAGGASKAEGTFFTGSNVSLTQAASFTSGSILSAEMTNIDTSVASKDFLRIDGKDVTIDWVNDDAAKKLAASMDKNLSATDGAKETFDDIASKLQDVINNSAKDQGLSVSVTVTATSGGTITIKSNNKGVDSEFSYLGNNAVASDAHKGVFNQLRSAGATANQASINEPTVTYNGKSIGTGASDSFNMVINGVKVTTVLATALTGGTTTMTAAATALQTAIQTAAGAYNTAKGLTAGVEDTKSGLTGLTASDFTVKQGDNGNFEIKYSGNEDVEFHFEDVGDRTVAANLGLAGGSSRAGGNGGLTLQIGDTSESFNKLTISVNDMHTTALGLKGVDISTQTGASAAMDAIKSAINKVSDTRGGLGALQNRLDHTINNLGVMRENIQNAESLIRDTDVAEEMMTYTKNNILNQSAQAMLAQANQLPQGVLQLLG